MRHTITDSVVKDEKEYEVVESDSVDVIPPDQMLKTESGKARIPVMIYSPNLEFSASGTPLKLFFSKYDEGKDKSGYASYIDPSDFKKVYNLGALVKPYWYSAGIRSAVGIKSTTEKGAAQALEYVLYEVALKDTSTLIKGLSGGDVLRTISTDLCSIGVPINSEFTRDINGTQRLLVDPVSYVSIEVTD